jgi:CheY-like chemotaxis protein
MHDCCVPGRRNTSGSGAALASAARSTLATILVAEDDTLVGRLIGAALEEASFRVHLAAGGAEALEVLARPGVTIDLLVTDVVMPGMNGPALVEAARRGRPDLPVVYLSGYPRELLAQLAGLDPTTDPVVEKPFPVPHLLDVIARALSRAG